MFGTESFLVVFDPLILCQSLRPIASLSALTSHASCSLQALEAVARLRCSSGLDVDKYMGAFYRRTATDVDLPAIHADQVCSSRDKNTGT